MRLVIHLAHMRQPPSAGGSYSRDWVVDVTQPQQGFPAPGSAYHCAFVLVPASARLQARSIALNYGRIRGVERELGNLQLQLKLTSGPKKHALELLRRKIETQNERVASVRAKHTVAKAVSPAGFR